MFDIYKQGEKKARSDCCSDTQPSAHKHRRPAIDVSPKSQQKAESSNDTLCDTTSTALIPFSPRPQLTEANVLRNQLGHHEPVVTTSFIRRLKIQVSDPTSHVSNVTSLETSDYSGYEVFDFTLNNECAHKHIFCLTLISRMPN